MNRDQLLRVLVRVGEILHAQRDEKLEDAAFRVVRERNRLRRELQEAYIRIKELRAELLGIGDAEDARAALAAAHRKNKVLKAEITKLHEKLRERKHQ